MNHPTHLHVEFQLKGAHNPIRIRFSVKEAFEIYLHDNVVEVGLKSSMTEDAFKDAHKKLGTFLREKKIHEVYLPEIDQKIEEQIYALFDGNYRFDRYLTQKSVFLKKVYLDVLPENLEQIGHVLDAQYMMKELLSTPYYDRKVTQFVSYAKELLDGLKNIQLEVHDYAWLKKEQMNLHCAVGKGSEATDPPALLLIHYRGGDPKDPFIGLAGKGMVFDTGGYSLKTSDGMLEMHGDCAGAALYLHLGYLLSKLGIRRNVLIALPIADNSISNNAYRLSDIVVGRSKKSVEITNTDAEGRLILADSVAYLSQNFHLSCLITSATLTGAVIIALGTKMAGLFCDNPELRLKLLESSERSHEPLWTLPFDKDSFMDLLKSEVADMKNAGKREASATQGAVFIYQHHMSNVPFAHLDVAGTMMNKSVGTSYGIRLFLDFVSKWKNS
ncbi:MAG: leucyl aminopeptidase family protein [Chlamydiia bacterium]